MGLKQRRAMKDFMENQLPQHLQEIRDIVGYEIEVEIDESSSQIEDNRAHLLEASWADGFMVPLKQALRNVCIDELGKEAMEASVKKIRLFYREFPPGRDVDRRKITFDNGVLSINRKPGLATPTPPSERYPNGDSIWQDLLKSFQVGIEENL